MAAATVAALDRVLRPTQSAVLHSQPDLDDAVVALLRGRPAHIEACVLADDARAAAGRARALGLDATLVRRRSLSGVWRYLRAAVTVSTHGLFGSPQRRAGRESVGLWHGEFGKRVGHLAGEPTRHFHWMPVSSELSRWVRCAEFALPPERVAVVGSPRQTLLGDPEPGRAAIGRRYVVWAPTYRATSLGAGHADGDPEQVMEALRPDDPDLGVLLDRHDAELIFRPHPAEEWRWHDGRIRTATDADLEGIGLTFYELLAGADCFITDYSSLWVDHLLCDRPMIAFCPDLAEYRASRGLALEPYEEWFPGPVVGTTSELLAALDSALAGQDEHEGRRAHTRRLLHTNQRSDPVAAVWQRIDSACTAVARR